MTLLMVRNLGFTYPQKVMFSNLSLQIPSGITLIRGGDGCGKTTLLRLLAGELAPQQGDLELGGVRLHEQPQTYRAQVCWFDPRTDVFDRISALDVFAQLRQVYPSFLATDSELLRELVVGLSLQPHLGKPLYTLSTGTKRKVWLVAAFAAGAMVTCLDDPLAALDKPSTLFVLDQLATLAQSTGQAWVVAHYELLSGVPLAQVIELGA